MVGLGMIRKIGRILRGKAGKREIFLGTFLGVLIGFNPTAGLGMVLVVLVTLLLNANVGFTLLAAAVGRVLAMLLAPLSFHTGFFIIHKIGLEGIFTKLVNAPVTALMDLDVYALVGGFPYALLIGILLGSLATAMVTKVREQMLRAGGNEKVARIAENKFARFLMWLVFGKQKISTADVLAKKSPLFRKSGLALVGGVAVLCLLFEFLLLNPIAKHAIRSAISSQTGAEVDVGKVDLSLAKGRLEIKDLQVADPSDLTRNMVQIGSLVTDIGVGELLRKNFNIDLVEGTTLRRNVPRSKPAKLYSKPRKKKETPSAAEGGEGAKATGKPLSDYFAKAGEWKRYGEKAYEYIRQHEQNAQDIAEGKKPKTTKEAAVADARRVGYLRARADLVADHPAWTISTLQITDVNLDESNPSCTIVGRRISSHPELLDAATLLALQDRAGNPLFKLILHFEDPAKPHELSAHLKNLPLGKGDGAARSFPLDINGGKANLDLGGTFRADSLNLPFQLVVHDLRAKAKEGQRVMGMDAQTADEVFAAMDSIAVDGTLVGSLRVPRIKIDYDKLAASLKQALVDSGKKALARQADKEMDKAKKKAGEEIGKLLGGDEGDGESTKKQAEGLIKKFF